MQKKELVMEIIGLYDEVTRLQEENKILKIQQGLAKISGDKVVLEESDPETRTPKSIIGDATRREYFQNHFWYRLRNHHPVVVENGSEKITRTFEEWCRYIGVEQMVGYDRDDREILAEVSLGDLKKFFLPELKIGYEELLAIETKKGGEKDGE